MKTLVSVIAIAVCSFATISASAQNNNPGLQDENKRIQKGVTSGELTVATGKICVLAQKNSSIKNIQSQDHQKLLTTLVATVH